MKDQPVARQSRGGTRSGHARSRRADHADRPDRYQNQQLAIWAVAEANRRRCAHRG